MSILRHIYRNNKLVHIPSKRYSRKYNPEYLKEKASKGVSTKLGIGDFDGDGDIDGTYPKQRAVVSEKPGLLVRPNLPPLRGPRFYDRVPIVSPHEGPVITRTVISPDVGPNALSSQILAPALGPSSASADVLPVGGPTNLTAQALNTYAIMEISDRNFPDTGGLFFPDRYHSDVTLIAQTNHNGVKRHLIAVPANSSVELYYTYRDWSADDVKIIHNYTVTRYQQTPALPVYWDHLFYEYTLRASKPFERDLSDLTAYWDAYWGGMTRTHLNLNGETVYELSTQNTPNNLIVTESQLQAIIARAATGQTDPSIILGGAPTTLLKVKYNQTTRAHRSSVSTKTLAPWQYWQRNVISSPVVSGTSLQEPFPNIPPRTGPTSISAQGYPKPAAGPQSTSASIITPVAGPSNIWVYPDPPLAGPSNLSSGYTPHGVVVIPNYLSFDGSNTSSVKDAQTNLPVYNTNSLTTWLQTYNDSDWTNPVTHTGFSGVGEYFRETPASLAGLYYGKNRSGALNTYVYHYGRYRVFEYHGSGSITVESPASAPTPSGGTFTFSQWVMNLSKQYSTSANAQTTINITPTSTNGNWTYSIGVPEHYFFPTLNVGTSNSYANYIRVEQDGSIS